MTDKEHPWDAQVEERLSEGYAARRALWLVDVDRYCERHGITREQFVAMFFEPNYDLDWRRLLWPSGEQNIWAEELRKK